MTALEELAGESISPLLQIPLHTPQDLDEYVLHLHGILEALADDVAPRKPVRRKARIPGWTRPVAELQKEAARAHRDYQRHRYSEARWERYQQCHERFRVALAEERRAEWREGLHQASSKTDRLWSLARWARTRSGKPPENRKMPAMRRPGDLTEHQGTIEKGQILSEKFFPTVMPGQVPRPQGNPDPLDIDLAITGITVTEALKDTSPWKAPGPDGFPTGFLKACGPSLAEALARLYTASMTISYWPETYRQAKVVVIPKPNKTRDQLQEAGGWRPIALLSCLGKPMEKILARRIVQTAGQAGIIPEEQFGNRPGRSTEDAIKLVVHGVETAWTAKGKASLLQLDLAGAFDRVHHGWLAEILRDSGLPPVLVRWIESWLVGRRAELMVDGVATQASVPAGVPQGSPMSPVLFLLFLRPLYQRLRRQGLFLAGFADDTNLLAVGRTHDECCDRLEAAYTDAETWANKVGMQFQPSKSEVIHFQRGRSHFDRALHLGAARVEPVKAARFLGVWLHQNLGWSAQIRILKAKMETQLRALTCLAGSVWGCDLRRARQLYTAVVRPAIVFGAAVTAQEGRTGVIAVGRALAPTQNAALRRISGGYRATPARYLEAEMGIPPLDLYMAQRREAYVQQVKDTEVAVLIGRVGTRIAHFLQRPRGLYRPPPDLWGECWPDNRPLQETVTEKWAARWERTAGSERAVAAGGMPPPRLSRHGKFEPRRVYIDARKSHSSVLFQMRTGCIGLRAFLHMVKVPEFEDPTCPCGVGPQTVEHLFTECTDERSTPLRGLGLPGPAEVHRALGSSGAMQMAKRLLETGWLPEYRVAEALRMRVEISAHELDLQGSAVAAQPSGEG